MTFKTAAFLSFLNIACTAAPYEITPQKLKSHVAFLSSDALEGRLTGSKGEQLATDYIARFFEKAGLEPAGDQGTFFQKFAFAAGVYLGKMNTLTLTNPNGITKHWLVNQDWRPLSFSDTGIFSSDELVFVGYGITTPDLSYDSYQGLKVKNKWVVVLQTPNKMTHEKSRYASLRYKAFIAKEHGAKGIVFVSGRDDALIPFASDSSLSGSGIVALSVKRKVLDDVLKDSGQRQNSLQKIERSLVAGEVGFVSDLPDIKITAQIDIKKRVQHGRNVLGIVRLAPKPTGTILLGAHVDHLGRGQLGGSRARANETGTIHPGADDNASGVATVLEVAAFLSGLKAQGQLAGHEDLLFAVWSGEEIGILGSTHFVRKIMKKNKSLRPSIAVAINLDMVGHLREGLVLQGVGSSSDWPQLIAQIKGRHTIPLVMQNDPYLPTDSTSFYLQGVPTLNLFTGAHDEYHSPRDTAETLNYAGMNSIANFLVVLLQALEEKPQLMSFQEVQKSRGKPEREFKIYLGTIPDYASADIAGVKISGVAKNSPAERAGVQHDDVIIQLAGKNVHDIYDYTYILNGLLVGKSERMIVVRGSKKVALTIVAEFRH